MVDHERNILLARRNVIRKQLEKAKKDGRTDAVYDLSRALKSVEDKIQSRLQGQQRGRK